MSLWLEKLNELDHYLALRREAEQHRALLLCRKGRAEARAADRRALLCIRAFLAACGGYLRGGNGPARGDTRPAGSKIKI